MSETQAPLGNPGCSNKTPLKPLEHHGSIVSRGPSTVPPLCRERRKYLTADAQFSSLDSLNHMHRKKKFPPEKKGDPFQLVVAILVNVLRTENFFRSLNKSNRNQIVFTMYRLIWIQMDSVRLLFQINRIPNNP